MKVEPNSQIPHKLVTKLQRVLLLFLVSISTVFDNDVYATCFSVSLRAKSAIN